MDLVRELGELALATRLRRLSERLSRDVSAVYESQALPFEARWFGLLVLLTKKKAMNVTAIAESLGLTHPAVNQVATVMLKRGLLKQSKAAGDARQRLLALSPKGKQLVVRLRPIWNDIREANEELVQQCDCTVLEVIEKLEDQLDRETMYARVMRRLHTRQLAAIEILPYANRYKKYFRTLNYDWLTKYFAVEPHDEVILSHPEREIIARRGQVFFARLDGEVVGTCAVVPHNRATVELSKMAVASSARRKQVGRKLAMTAIAWGRDHGYGEIVLFTSKKLVAAIGLYQALGFVEIPMAKEDKGLFRRPSIKMTRNLESDQIRKLR